MEKNLLLPENGRFMKYTTSSIMVREDVERMIFLLRGEKVMLSTDLSKIYQVAPKVLIQAVKRNSDRFPDDFMFQILKSQIVTSSWGGLRRALPYAFTEHGILMLRASCAVAGQFRSISRSCERLLAFAN